MYNELILSVQKFKESSPDTEVIPDGKKLLFIMSKRTQNSTHKLYKKVQ